jgi:hypothetical protein
VPVALTEIEGVMAPVLHRYDTTLLVVVVESTMSPPWQNPGRLLCEMDTVGIVPDTFTTAVADEVFPLTSVAVKVTVLLPILVQLNVFGATLIEAMVQLSNELLSTDEGVMDTVPPDKVTVIFLVITVGLMVSFTVTTAVAVFTLLFTSFTVSVTVFAPTFAQLKAVFDKVLLKIPHASDEPLFTKAAVVEALPVASSQIVTFCVTTTGLIVSFTVTTAVAEFTLEFTSVTVSVTVLVPTLEQSNEVFDKVLLAIPQASEDPLFTAATVVEAFPVASR